MNRSSRPPALAIWLLTLRLADEWREFVIGDLEEEFVSRAVRAPIGARVWFWSQTIRALVKSFPALKVPVPPTEGDSTMRVFLHDLRFAGRTLGRSPGFAVLAVGIMALGIGANTAVFSIVNGVLLKPLPYADADRIVALQTLYLTNGGQSELVSIANYRDWRAQSSSFEAFASYRGGGETPVGSGVTAEYTRTANVDADFFRVFGVQPVLGRTFSSEETAPGTARVAVISHSY